MLTIFFAKAYAQARLIHQAETILTRIETSIGETGLIPEGLDTRTLSLWVMHSECFANAIYSPHDDIGLSEDFTETSANERNT